MTERDGGLKIPEDCAPGTYKLVREYFIANYLDGDEGGQVTVDASVLADTIAGLFSSDDWRATWNEALLKEMRQVASTGDEVPECGHYFHASTSHGFCPQCGGQWKRRHRRTGGSMSSSGEGTNDDR